MTTTTNATINPEYILDTAHALIAGATGCGKSVLLHQVVLAALRRGPAHGELFLIDLKRGVEFCDYEGRPGVTRFCLTPMEALAALDEAIRVMTARLDVMRRRKEKLYAGADLWVIIDQMGFLLQSARKEALPRLTQISQQGRAARVHLICATQNPGRSNRTGIPAEIQQNMTLKVALHCTTATESRQIVGVKGAEDLPKHGTALVWDSGFVEAVSVPNLTPEQIAAALKEVSSQETRRAAFIRRFRTA